MVTWPRAGPRVPIPAAPYPGCVTISQYLQPSGSASPSGKWTQGQSLLPRATGRSQRLETRARLSMALGPQRTLIGHRGGPWPMRVAEGRSQFNRPPGDLQGTCPCYHDKLERLWGPSALGRLTREGPLPSCVFSLEQATLPLCASASLSVKWG